MFKLRHKKYKTELTDGNTDNYTAINSDVSDVTDRNADLTWSVQRVTSELDWKGQVPTHSPFPQRGRGKDGVKNSHRKIFRTHP